MGLGASYRVVVLLGGHVSVAFAPVESHLLLLLLIEPHQLLGGGQHEGVQLVQVPQAGLGGGLVGSKVTWSRPHPTAPSLSPASQAWVFLSLFPAPSSVFNLL